MKLAQLAQVVHESAKTLYRGFNLRDDEPAWSALPAAVRGRFIEIVQAGAKDRKINAGIWHETWCRELKNDGWVIGPYPNSETKQHPALVTYTELPIHGRMVFMMQADLIRICVPMLEDLKEKVIIDGDLTPQ